MSATGMKKGRKLGEGTYGIVYSGESIGNKSLAIKRNLTQEGSYDIASSKELDIITRVSSHINILPILKVIFGDKVFDDKCLSPLPNSEEREGQKNDNVHFVFPKALCDLYTYIREQRVNYMTYKMIVCDILLGTEFLHSKGIIHRDLKTSNILVFQEKADIYAKICDFGLSKYYTYNNLVENTICVSTSTYKAPEMCAERFNYDYKVDIWAIGCILYECLSTRYLVDVDNDTEDKIILAKIAAALPRQLTDKELLEYNIEKDFFNRKRKSWVEKISFTHKSIVKFEQECGSTMAELSDFLDHLLDFNSKTRYTATMALNHRFMLIMKQEIKNSLIRSPLGKEKQKPFIINDCIERKWACKLIMFIYKNRACYPSWYYDDRIIFHTMAVIDIYLTYLKNTNKINPNAIESENKGLYMSREDAHLKFMSCLALFVKYFRCCYKNIPFEILCQGILEIDKEAKEKNLAFQGCIIYHVLKYRIYEPTLFEECENFNIIATDKMMEELLEIYLYKIDKINGRTSNEIFKDYLAKKL